MAKQPKNLRDLIAEAKSFPDVLAHIVKSRQITVRSMTELLKKRHAAAVANRPMYQRSLSEAESVLRSLETRRQRYDDLQANKRIPAALRKRLADAETQLLRQEFSGSDFAGSLRYHKAELTKLFEEVDRHLNPPKPLTTKNKAFKVGGQYPRQSITRAYDGHIEDVLKGHFEILPRSTGEKARVKITAALPEKSEYLQLKDRHFGITVEALIDDAFEVIEELRDEMQEVFDNMPEGLQQGPVGIAREEAASQLAGIADEPPDVPQLVASLRLVHYPDTHQVSRSDRAGEAAAKLEAAIEAVKGWKTTQTKLGKADLAAVEEFCDGVEQLVDELNGVEFPGMYG